MAESPRKSDSDYSDKDENEDNDYKDRIAETSPKGRFIRFNEELGFGAYKTVYRAYDNDSGCEVAWNVIKLQRLPLNERKRISEEIQLLKNLHHPNIINFINAWINKSKNEVIFITECVSGGSLKKHLKKIKKPRLKIIKNWCRQILKGLVYLHEQKPYPIIHRDIKCENVFINTTNNEIRIGDLGLAVSLKNSSHTKSVIGTPEFMAPEIYEEKYGTPVDIYSFGMCVLEMATLSTPYKECTSAAQVYKKVSQGILPYQIDLIQNEGLKNLILKCLSHYKDRPSAEELLNDKFLDMTEQDEDNYPVQLLDTNNPSTPISYTLSNSCPLESAYMFQQKNQKNTEISPCTNQSQNNEIQSQEIHSDNLKDDVFFPRNQSIFSDKQTTSLSHKKKKNQLTIDVTECDFDEVNKQQQLALQQQQEKLIQQDLAQVNENISAQTSNITSLVQQSDSIETDSNYKTPQNQRNKSRINTFNSQSISVQNNQSIQNNCMTNNNSVANQSTYNQVELNESIQSTSERFNIQKAYQNFQIFKQDQSELDTPADLRQISHKEQKLPQQTPKGSDIFSINNSQINSSNYDIPQFKNNNGFKFTQDKQVFEESGNFSMASETPDLGCNLNNNQSSIEQKEYETSKDDHANQQNKNQLEADQIVQNDLQNTQSLSDGSSQTSSMSINQGIYLNTINYSLTFNEYSQDTYYRYAFTLEIRDSLYPFDITVDKNLINNRSYNKETISNLIDEALNQLECQDLEKLHDFIINDAVAKFSEFQVKKKKFNKQDELDKRSSTSPSKTSNIQLNMTPDEKKQSSQQLSTNIQNNQQILAAKAIQDDDDDNNSDHEIEDAVFYNAYCDDYNQISSHNPQEYTQNQIFYQNNYSRLDNTQNNIRTDHLAHQTSEPSHQNHSRQQSYISTHSVQLNSIQEQTQNFKFMNQNPQYCNNKESNQISQSVQLFSIDSHNQKNSTALPQNVQKSQIFPTPPQFSEKNQCQSPPNHYNFSKLIDNFIDSYKKYWEQNYEQINQETQELLKFRQQKELIELQRLHISQRDLWLTNQMNLTVNQYEKQDAFQLQGKQGIKSQSNFMIYQGDQANNIQTNHSVLDISNISNVKEIDNDNHISPQLKDSIDMELSNMLLDNPTNNILGNTYTKTHSQQTHQSSLHNSLSLNTVNQNNIGLVQQVQVETIVSPSNVSIGNQQFIQSMQIGETTISNKKQNLPIRTPTPKQTLNESLSQKQNQQVLSKNSQQIQNQNTQMVSNNFDQNLNHQSNSFQNQIHANNDKIKPNFINNNNSNIIQTQPIRTHHGSIQIQMQNPKMSNKMQQSDKPYHQNPVQQQQQLQQQQQQYFNPQQQQFQQQAQPQSAQTQIQQNKMNSKPPTPKQIINQQNNSHITNNLTPSSQGAQQPLKPIKHGQQQIRQNFIHSATNSQDSSYFSFQFMNEIGQPVINQQSQTSHSKIKSSQNLNQYFYKSQTPPNASSNIAHTLNQNGHSHNQAHMPITPQNQKDQYQQNYIKSETPEICQLQKPLTKLTKKQISVQRMSMINSNSDLSCQEINQHHHNDKKESGNKSQYQQGIITQTVQSEGRDGYQSQAQQQQQQTHHSHNVNNNQMQNQQFSQQIQGAEANQLISNNFQQHHQNSHHPHSAIIQRSQPNQQASSLNQNTSLDFSQKGFFKNNNQETSQALQNVCNLSQQSSQSTQNDQSPMNQFLSFNPIQNKQVNQESQNQNNHSASRLNLQIIENTNTPQFSPVPSKQNSHMPQPLNNDSSLGTH